MREWKGHVNDSDPAKVPLDPITVAGQAYMDNLAAAAEDMNIPFAKDALAICMQPQVFLSLFKDQNPRWSQPNTAHKWSDHVASLLDAGVIREISSHQLVNSAKYFGVFKSPEVARSIWNGRYTSQLMRPPKNVNLPYLPRILKMIDDLTHKHGSLAFIEGDIRHFFHQLRVHPDIGCYLGLRLAAEGNQPRTFAWNCVPMGLSWSPYVAQSIAWLSILYRRRQNQKNYFKVEPSQLAELPEFLLLNSGGFITVYYDNILAVSPDATELKGLFNRIKENMSDDKDHGFNLCLKRLDFYSPSTLRSTTVNFLGAEIRIRRQRSTVGGFMCQCLWRQASPPDASVEDIRSRLEGKLVSARTVARFVGKLIWIHALSLNPIGDISGLLILLSRVSKARAAEKKDWGTPFLTLSADECRCILNLWEHALRNDWLTTYRPESVTEFWATSDSCDESWGWFIHLPKDTSMKRECGFTWSDALAASHIFIKETLAAVWTVRCILTKSTGSVEIHLGVDNTAAVAALTHRYSGCRAVLPPLAEMSRLLDERQSTLEVHRLRSEDNSSDAISRGGTCHPTVERACLDIMQQQTEGIIDMSRRETLGWRSLPKTSTSTIRHDDKVDPEEEVNDVLTDQLVDDPGKDKPVSIDLRNLTLDDICRVPNKRKRGSEESDAERAAP